VRHAVTAARRAGIPLRRVLAGTGLTETAVIGARYAIDQHAENLLVTNLIGEMGDAVAAGITVGSEVSVGDLGIWGYALISSATGAEALSVAVNYISLAPTMFRPQVCNGDTARVVLRDEHLPVDVRDYYAARDMSVLPLLIRTAALTDMPLTVETRFAADQGARLAASLAPIRVKTGVAQHAIRFTMSGLSVALPTADPVTRAACARECERLVHTQSSAAPLSATIRSRLAQRPDTMPGIDELAAELHMSTRTLRRQLDAEQTSYRELRADVTQTLATELLGVVGLSVNEVARRLGYSDTTAFSHAFRRWTGRAASDYRAHRAG